MSVALVTGAGGLIGSEAVAFLAAKGFDVRGVDNDTRAKLFGAEASTAWRLDQLAAAHPTFRNTALDIRDFDAISRLIADLGAGLSLVIHAAAQPSHDWAASDPFTDFGINAQGTLIGIISHIREMKERISTPIQVVKKSDGFSVVEIVG